MHVERTGSFSLTVEPDFALPLFSPEGERAWVAGWDPEPLHAPDGSLACSGAAFRTAAGGEETLWLTLRFDRAARVAEYARITPGSRLGTVRVEIQPTPDGARVTVTYALTALSPAGAAELEKLTPAAYEQMLADWQSKIAGMAKG